MRKFVLFCSILFFLTHCSKDMRPLKTVDHIDINKYLGKWYEIARLPNTFEKGLICTTAEYSMRGDGKIRVLNTGHKEKDTKKIKTAEGKAWVPDPAIPSRLKVQFFWPFRGDYYIFHLDEVNYQYALVGDPSRKYFWLLSRTPSISDELYENLLDVAGRNGFDTTRFYKPPQICH